MKPSRRGLSLLKFIDLFAGIGGFHYGLASFGARCVFASEWDQNAAKVYERNHALKPHGDITQIHEKDIPAHDVLCGGFPCQAFSVSGKQMGFNDTRGTLFFDIARIAAHHQPQILFLENVKNLVKHADGQTLATMLRTLTELSYHVRYQVLNASEFGLPQSRERLYLVGFRDKAAFERFHFPAPVNTPVCVAQILEKEPSLAKVIVRDDVQIYRNHLPQPPLFGEAEPVNRPLQIGIVNKGGQGERIYHPAGHGITLSAYGGGVGAKTGLYLVNDVIRKLSPRECARLLGFPESFILDPSPAQSYKQFGNSLCIDVIQYILGQISSALSPGED